MRVGGGEERGTGEGKKRDGDKANRERAGEWGREE